MKRLFDVVVSMVILILVSPVLLVTLMLVWLQDRHSPFYIAPRVGRGGRSFRMIKVRSMVVNADLSGVDSTSANDQRITWVGRFVRRFKIDELGQLFNVLGGEMSLVGPRPQVQRDVDLYTTVERGLLSVVPGITDFASIVFSDEGDILKDATDPDLAYQQLIRPWKSRLGLFYAGHASLRVDIELVGLTAMAVLARPHALRGVVGLLKRLGADPALVAVSSREAPLVPHPPPGASETVRSR